MDRGKRWLLVGDPESRRTKYFQLAAGSSAVKVYTWQAVAELSEEQCKELFEGAVIKLDPPSYPFFRLDEMQQELVRYRTLLEKLSRIEADFLNPPRIILTLLDKLRTKQDCERAGIRTTKLIGYGMSDTEQLWECMKQARCYGVFIKPRYFSGAAGIVALRVHPENGQMTAYTSCRLEQGYLVNTKKLKIVRNRRDILPLLKELWKLDCLVERWHPKSRWGDTAFDLRIVYQFGHIRHGVVRTSKHPITNLHLSDGAVSCEQLGLLPWQWEQLEQLCRQAVQCFDGLRVCGLDVMIDRAYEEDKWVPRIIEMNGQGDLLYDDIYKGNQIYGEQVREWKKTNTHPSVGI